MPAPRNGRRLDQRIVGACRDTFRCRRHLRHGQRRMGQLMGGHVVGGNHDARAELGHAVQLGGERGRQPDAAVGGRIAGHHAGVQRHARPGDALHEGHRRAAVDVGAVVAALGDHAEHAGRRRKTALARGNGALGDQALGPVDRDALLADRDDGEQRAPVALDLLLGRRRSAVGVALGEALGACLRVRGREHEAPRKGRCESTKRDAAREVGTI